MLTGLSTLTTPLSTSHATGNEVGDAVHGGRADRQLLPLVRSPELRRRAARCRRRGRSGRCSSPSVTSIVLRRAVALERRRRRRRRARASAPPSPSSSAPVDVDAADAEDDVALLRCRRRRPGCRPPTVVDLGAGQLDELAAWRVHGEQQHDRDQHVHQRAGGDHEQPARERLLPVRAGLVGRRHLVDVVHADDAHEGAERQQPARRTRSRRGGSSTGAARSRGRTASPSCRSAGPSRSGRSRAGRPRRGSRRRTRTSTCWRTPAARAGRGWRRRRACRRASPAGPRRRAPR